MAIYPCVDYTELKPNQKENFNFQKVSALLADHGFMTLRVSSDWESADFIAQHVDGVRFLKVQLKSRFTIDRKYCGKDLHICFPDRAWGRTWDRNLRTWYLCPHDKLMDRALKSTKIGNRKGWLSSGTANAKKPPPEIRLFLENYVLGPDGHPNSPTCGHLKFPHPERGVTMG